MINKNGERQAADDAEIRFFYDGKLMAMTATDLSGKFKLAGLNNGKYILDCVIDDRSSIRCEAVIEQCNVDLGTLVFG